MARGLPFAHFTVSFKEIRVSVSLKSEKNSEKEAGSEKHSAFHKVSVMAPFRCGKQVYYKPNGKCVQNSLYQKLLKSDYFD